MFMSFKIYYTLGLLSCPWNQSHEVYLHLSDSKDNVGNPWPNVIDLLTCPRDKGKKNHKWIIIYN